MFNLSDIRWRDLFILLFISSFGLESGGCTEENGTVKQVRTASLMTTASKLMTTASKLMTTASKLSTTAVQKSCEPRCEGSWIIDSQCNRRDCSVFGTTCITDPTPRCGTPECPRDGEATVCLDDHLILGCEDGLLTGVPGDCSAYGAWCSTAGVSETEARCVSALCFERDEVPYDHEVCSINQGFKLSCYSDGGIEERPCPQGEICSVQGGTAHCRSPLEGCNGPSDTEGLVDHNLCLGGGVGRCYNGNIISELRCDLGEVCYDESGPVRCLESTCLDGSGALIEGEVCRDERELIECDDEGVVINSLICADGERCSEIQGRARCVFEGLGEINGGEMSGGEMSGGEMSGGEMSEEEEGRLSPEMTYQMEEDDEVLNISYSCHQLIPPSRHQASLLMLLGALILRLRFSRSIRWYIELCSNK